MVRVGYRVGNVPTKGMTLESAVSDIFLVLTVISEHKYTSQKEELLLFGLYCNYWDVMGITSQSLRKSKNFQLALSLLFRRNLQIQNVHLKKRKVNLV